MTSSGLQLVGWYHSHPSSDPLPSVNDVTQQLVYQEVVMSNEGDFPCVGMIISEHINISHDCHMIKSISIQVLI